MCDSIDRLKKHLLTLASGITLLICVSTTSGCSSLQGVQNYIAYNDATNDFVMGWRNSVWARQAWAERKGQFVDEPQFHAFGEGFRAGYEDVAGGGNGCPPAIPPRTYWSWKYQSPEGQAKTAAWFTGYPYGARAAEEDGAGLYQQIQVSHTIERQYSPEFINGTVIPPEYLPASTPPGAVAPSYEGIPSPLPVVPGAPEVYDSSSNADNRREHLPAIRHGMEEVEQARRFPVVSRGQNEWPATVQISAVMPVGTPTIGASHAVIQ